MRDGGDCLGQTRRLDVVNGGDGDVGRCHQRGRRRKHTVKPGGDGDGAGCVGHLPLPLPLNRSPGRPGGGRVEGIVRVRPGGCKVVKGGDGDVVLSLATPGQMYAHC